MKLKNLVIATLGIIILTLACASPYTGEVQGRTRKHRGHGPEGGANN